MSGPLVEVRDGDGIALNYEGETVAYRIALDGVWAGCYQVFDKTRPGWPMQTVSSLAQARRVELEILASYLARKLNEPGRQTHSVHAMQGGLPTLPRRGKRFGR